MSRSIQLIASFYFIFGIIHTSSLWAQQLPEPAKESIERLLLNKMAEEKIPGLSISIVNGGEIVWSNGYGLADIENDIMAKPTTAYRTASIGKSMTAVAVMQLVEQGKVDLNAPIQQYCSSFPTKRWPIMTKHLLSHTSGIRHYGGERTEEELFNTVHYDNVVEAMDIFKGDALLFEPGTAFQYSTFGYNVLGCIIEGASGMRYMDYMHSQVFEPSGMHNTRDDDPSAIVPNRARGYVRTAQGSLQNSRWVDMSSKLPAGGFITTVEDLSRFAAAFMNRELVDGNTLEMMLKLYELKNGEKQGNGLGWGVFPDETWYGEREAFHGGVTPQVSGMLYLLPDRNFAVSIITNLENVSNRTGLAAEIAKIALNLGS